MGRCYPAHFARCVLPQMLKRGYPRGAPWSSPGINTLGRESTWNIYIHTAYRRHPKGLLVEFPRSPALFVPAPPLWPVTPPLVSSRRRQDRRSVLPSPSRTAAPLHFRRQVSPWFDRRVVWYELSLLSKNCRMNSSFPDPTHIRLAPMWFLAHAHDVCGPCGLALCAWHGLLTWVNSI